VVRTGDGTAETGVSVTRAADPPAPPLSPQLGITMVT
jgi:hypothetical protein